MRNATEIDHLIHKNILAENDSAFIFYQEKFKENLRHLKSAFTKYYPNVVIGYSYKTNYTPDVCLAAHEEGALAEVVSEMEVEMALYHLKDHSQIIYNGPTKSKPSIEKVILAGGIINIDSQKDIEIIGGILAENSKLTVNVAFRLNSNYGEDYSRFGQPVEAVTEQIDLLKSDAQFNIIGFHLHLPHRSLESFAHRVDVLIDILGKIDLPNIKYINVGGGYFGKLSSVLKQTLGVKNAPSYEDYGELIGGRLFDFFSNTSIGNVPTLYLEPGSSVIADCFTFVSNFHALKSFKNRDILVSFAGRHLLSPTNKTIKLPCAIINTQAQIDQPTSEKSQYEIVGYTCIESDILGLVEGNVNLDLNNSFVEFTNVGSYSIVMGSNFILPEPPIFRIDGENEIKTIRKRREAREVLDQFLL
jgi:diaminopimelate decarboxylase